MMFEHDSRYMYCGIVIGLSIPTLQQGFSQARMSRIAQFFGFLQRNWQRIITEGSINFALPYIIYSLVQPHYGDVIGLIASSAPPTLWSIVEFIRARRVDALSMLVLAGIVLSLLAYIGGGGAKFLQLREKLVTIIISIAFLGSAAIGKPLIYELAKAGMKRNNNEEGLKRFESLRDNAGFKRSMMLMTLVWGFGMLADAGVSIVLVFMLSIKEYLIVNPILGYTTMGTLTLWTFWYSRKRQREGDAMRAAEEARKAEQAQAEDLAAKPAD